MILGPFDSADWQIMLTIRNAMQISLKHNLTEAYKKEKAIYLRLIQKST